MNKNLAIFYEQDGGKQKGPKTSYQSLSGCKIYKISLFID